MGLAGWLEGRGPTYVLKNTPHPLSHRRAEREKKIKNYQTNGMGVIFIYKKSGTLGGSKKNTEGW